MHALLVEPYVEDICSDIYLTLLLQQNARRILHVISLGMLFENTSLY